MSTKGTAIFSPCGRYRYWLTREWGPPGKVCTFVMLNPSTAGATQDDPTIRRCIGYAKRWGCVKLIVVNIFALRSTDPRALRTASCDPIGELNKEHIESAVEIAGRQEDIDLRGPVVCAWGVHGSFMDHGETALGWIESALGKPPLALVVTKDGHPAHPLYLRGDLTPVPYAGRVVTA